MKRKAVLIVFLLIIVFTPMVRAAIIVVQVNMSGITINPAGMHVAGTFNNWNPNGPLMTELGGGIYEQAFTVPDNSVVQFKFINGANMSDAENVPAACAVGGNRSVNIGTENLLVGPYCFGQCGNCEIAQPTTTTVTFKVDMTGQNVANGVRIAGNFQNWDPAASSMNLTVNNIYTFTATVPIGGTILYKFINGNQWSGAESVPAACGESDGFGGFNRELSIGNTTIILDAVCFGSCTSCATTSTNELESNAVQLFPNPARGEVNVHFSTLPDDVSIVNMLGKRIWQTQPSQMQMRVDLSALSSGLYFIVVTQREKINIQRLLIE